MQNFILVLALVLFTSLASFGQCNKKVKWQASKVEMIDVNGKVFNSKERVITITADSINISLQIDENPGNKTDGIINESTCEWKEAFKNGKTVLKTSMTDEHGSKIPGTFTIEGNDGKLTITIEMENMQGNKIRVFIDKYETI